MTDLPDAVKKPCNDCPWRRTAAPGWLGPYDANQWIELAHSDEPIACHLTIIRDDDWEAPGIKQCQGAAIYRANMAKRPRNPEVVVAESDRETIFSTPQEFSNHHDRSGHGSL